MAEPVIQVSDLTYYFPQQERPALEGVNLAVFPGEFVLLTGPSGCGKSTLALSLNGIVPTVMGGRIKGRVMVNGTDTRRSTVYALGTQVGLVFQDPEAQLCNLMVEEEVAFGPANLLVERATIELRVTEALAAVGELALRPRAIHEISGGQKQRVALASVLAMQPEIIVFDEPTANLDPLGAVQVFELIRRLNREHGITVLVIEHNVDVAMGYADRLVLMQDGRVVGEGQPRRLMGEMGEHIWSGMGLRIPPVCELALALRGLGLELEPFPLTVPEAARALVAQKARFAFRPENSRPAPDRPAQGPVIETRGLSFDYPNGQTGVREVDLAVARGEVVAIVGKNGSGKSTLASLLVGLLMPSGGEGRVCGLALGEAGLEALTGRVGYVFQYPEHQFVSNTVYEEVAFGLKAQGQTADLEARVEAVLASLRLSSERDVHPLRLSMGQKRRLSVATMLVLDTEVLILDEPTTGQDRENIDNIMEIMMAARERGATVLIITHDMNLVARYCGRIVVMEAGRPVYQGSCDSFCRDFAQIPSQSLVLPDIYQLAAALRQAGLESAPEARTVPDLVAGMEIR